MSKSPNSVEIRLLNQRIALKTAGDPELIHEVIQVVSKKIEDAEKRVTTSVPHHVALLALLDLAEEHAQAKRKVADYQKQVESKARELRGLIEAEFK